MLTPRKLYRQRRQEEKLMQALRDLYRDGVRVCTGQLPAPELMHRHVEARRAARARAAVVPLRLAADAPPGKDPYNRRD